MELMENHERGARARVRRGSRPPTQRKEERASFRRATRAELNVDGVQSVDMDDRDRRKTFTAGATGQTLAAVEMGGPHEEPKLPQGNLLEERAFPPLEGQRDQHRV